MSHQKRPLSVINKNHEYRDVMPRGVLQLKKIVVLALAPLLFFFPLQAAERVILDGVFAQGGMVLGHAPPGAAVSLDGQVLSVAKSGRFVFGFDRDQGPHAALDIVHADGAVEHRDLSIEAREYDIQRIDGLPPGQVTPRTKEQLAHIRRDQEMKRQAREVRSQGTWVFENFIWPLTGRISGVYGSQRILNGEPRRPHYGVDVAAPTGTDFVAPAGGVVILASEDMYFEGGLIFLDHGHGVTSAFLHLDSVSVAVGDEIAQGDVLGTVGAQGRATGPHLDWRMDWYGKQLDPVFLVGPMPESVQAP